MAKHIKIEGAVLWLTQLAYRKTVSLITTFSDEVAWHGIATKLENGEFVLEDILVYPQEVTGSTVNTDQDGYTEWLYAFDDDTFSKIRMQGHSHVNMSVSPSVDDDRHREQILNQLEGDMFYIFMVWNKRLETHTLIYDIVKNVMYEDGDITMKIAGDDSLDEFMADAKEKVQKKRAAVRVRAKGSRHETPPGSLLSYLHGQGYGLQEAYE